MTEQLTDLQRHMLGDKAYGREALRIIDAHAAERAALVTQLEAAKLRATKLDEAAAILKHVRPGDLPSEIRPKLRAYWDSPPAPTTRERDEALKLAGERTINHPVFSRVELLILADAVEQYSENDEGAPADGREQETLILRDRLDAYVAGITPAESEVTSLTEALAAAEQNVQRITSERLIIEKAWRAAEARARELEAEVSGLREALALERDLVTLHAGGASRAEVQVRELTERVSQALTGLRPGSPVREALEEALRAP